MLSRGVACHAIDWCRLQAPLDPTVTAGGSFDAYGRLNITGLTNLTPGIDAAPALRAAFGVGNAGTEPASHASCSWLAATATPGWNGTTAGEPDNDEYTSTTPPARLAPPTSRSGSPATAVGPGRSAIATRAGSENGYQTSSAGHLTVK